MAQIIKHRRGSLEALSAVTASLSKGEIIIASGSSNLSVNNGSSIVFAVPENGQVQAVNRFLIGAFGLGQIQVQVVASLVVSFLFRASKSSV